MRLEEYQRAVLRGYLGRPDVNPVSHGVLGLCGEAGEVANLALKAERVLRKPLDADAFLEELGDVLWYLAFLAGLYGVSVEELAAENYAKLSARYPDKYPPLTYG